MMLAEFLATYESYLFKDLNAMAGIRGVPGGGGVGYPMVATALAGIELFGKLLAPKAQNDSECFKIGWTLVYPDEPEKRLGGTVYTLARNGLAHHFAAKPYIKVPKDGIPEGHLKHDGSGNLTIDALVLLRDLEKAYPVIKQKLLSSAHAEHALQKLCDEYELEARHHKPIIASAPRLLRLPENATGSTFTSASSKSPLGSG